MILAAILVASWTTAPRVPSTYEGDGDREENGRSYSGQVTCEADCQVSFGSISKPIAEGKHQERNEGAGGTDHNPLTIGEADLLAQERMAHWTKVIGVLTAAGLGILFVTFEATRDAVIETRKIGEAQTRGYVTPGGCRLLASDNDGKPKIEITIENCGATPVYELRIAASIEFGPKGENAPQRFPIKFGKLFADPFSSATIGGHDSAPIHLKYGGPWPYSERASRVLTSENYMHYFGLIFYRDAFDQLWEQDIYFLVFKDAANELGSRNITLNSKPRKIKHYPKE